MPFGLSNAPATQQKFVDCILAGLQWQTCVVYIDDIVIFSKMFEEHARSLREILERLDSHKLKLNLSKVSLCQPKFKILGFTASKDGIEPNQTQIDAIKNYPIPADRKELLAFLGIMSWCRRFIYKCSSKTYFLRIW